MIRNARWFLAHCVVLFVASCATQPPLHGDTTPPSLTSSTPADGAQDVARNLAVVLGFSEPIADLQLTPSPLVGLAEPLWDQAGQAVTVAPSPAWPAGTSLTFTIDAEDEHGNTATFGLTFSTVDDDEPPAAPVDLLATARDGAVDLSWTANVEPDLAGYLVFWGEDVGAPTGVVALPAGAVQYTVSPLDNGTSYQFALATEDEAGNRSAPSVTVTATPGDSTAPRLISSLPSDGVSGVGLVELVRFLFSEPLAPGSLQLSLHQVEAPDPGDHIDPVAPIVQTLDVAELGEPTWNAAGSLVQFTDVALDLFESDKAYRFELRAEDAAGNPLPSPTSVSFQAGLVPDVVPPTVLGLEAAFVSHTGAGTVRFEFSEAMDQPSTEGAFDSAPGLACQWSWSSERLLECGATGGLVQEQVYAVQFTTAATDLMGNALEAVWNATFTTPNLNPRLVDFTPKGRLGMIATTNDQYQPITWTFSEAVVFDTIAGEVRAANGALFDTIAETDDLHISLDGRTITYVPPTAYHCLATIYTWTLTRVREQGSGQSPVLNTPQDYSGSFRCGEPVVGPVLAPATEGE